VGIVTISSCQGEKGKGNRSRVIVYLVEGNESDRKGGGGGGNRGGWYWKTVRLLFAGIPQWVVIDGKREL